MQGKGRAECIRVCDKKAVTSRVPVESLRGKNNPNTYTWGGGGKEMSSKGRKNIMSSIHVDLAGHKYLDWNHVWNERVALST